MTRIHPLIAAAVCVALATVPAAAGAAFPGEPGKLVFSSLADGDKNLYAADAEPGSAWLPLTTDAGEDAQAAWSPDGTRLAFRARRPGEHYFEIYLVNADGTGQRRLTSTPRPENGALPYSSQPSWSPDGTEIVFRSNRDGEPDVWLMSADGMDARRVADDPGDERYPGFSPDGTRIAFTSTRDGDTDVYTMRRDGGDVQQLTHNDVYDSAPAWSPDGARIAFERGAAGDDPTNEVWTMAAAGGDEHRLTHNDALDEGAAWSPDGARIAFTSARSDPDGDIFVMNGDGSDPHVVAASPEVEESPDWQGLPHPGAPPGGAETAAPPAAGADDPSAPGAQQAPAPGAAQRPARRQHLAAPRRIRLGTLLRRGLPVRVACEPACGARVRLLVPPRRGAVSQRARHLGPAPLRLRLRVRRRAAARLRAVRARRLLVRVTFTRRGERPQVLQARVRLRR
jgi:dipeptidyl aminopeptidase/acylaminoacyl peptidase